MREGWKVREVGGLTREKRSRSGQGEEKGEDRVTRWKCKGSGMYVFLKQPRSVKEGACPGVFCRHEESQQSKQHNKHILNEPPTPYKHGVTDACAIPRAWKNLIAFSLSAAPVEY